MSRRHVIKDLSSYMDNQLLEEKRLEVEEHLKSCQLCSQELLKLKLISEKIKTLPAPDLGPFFEEAVKEKIRDPQGLERGEVKMKKKTWVLLIPSGVLAGILVFVFIGRQVYVKQSLEGKIRIPAGSLGDQYAPRDVERQQENYYSKNDLYNLNGARDNSATLGSTTVYDGLRSDAKYQNKAMSLAFSNSASYEPAKAGEAVRRDYIGTATMDVRNGSMAEGGLVARKAGEQYAQALSGPFSDNASVIVIQPTLPATGEGDKIIRTAEIRLEVENGQETYKQASAVCQELGGYLAASNFYQDAQGRQAGTITMRIPKEKFLTALDKLSALGKVEGSSTQSQDVGQEYANLKANHDAAMVVYNKMLEALQKRQNTISDAVRLESELTPVLQRIANLKNQMEVLNNSVSFTTVNLYFHEAEISAKVLKDARQNIQKSMLAASINAVRFFGNVIPVGLILIFWVVLIIGAVVLLKNWIKRLFKRG